MQEQYRHKRKKLMSEINVVPYIDVMLVLLIIFMITAPMLKEGVKVELPQAAAKPVDIKDQETLVISIDKKGKLYLDDRAIERNEMVNKIARIIKVRPKTEVLIRGDRRIAYGEVVSLMAQLQKAGIGAVGLATEPAPRKR
ncbi:MAG: protein TolR [Proteobacteria bacterium]|nr:protein TolR [Pseudomonadota bacterium]